jgi:putative endonuclease
MTKGRAASRQLNGMPSDRFWIYIATNGSRTLYTGVTNDLRRRIAEHRLGTTPGFTSRYRIDRLVYFETTLDVFSGLAREKQIKRWSRRRRIALIEARNPTWRDLALFD